MPWPRLPPPVWPPGIFEINGFPILYHITGKPDFKVKLFREVLDRIRNECDMIVNLTTSGLRLTGPDVIARRLQPVYLKPDICSLDLGSMNFHDRVFENPPEWSDKAARCMRENGVKPEIEVFEPGHIRQAADLMERGLIDPPAYFQLCMGVRWGIEASPENLVYEESIALRGPVECLGDREGPAFHDHHGYPVGRQYQSRF
jgi:uncharacterized protein (DUF849 family)